MQRLLPAALLAGLMMASAVPAHAFCGFYVAKADAKLFNKASKVVVARKGERTTVTMASDYQGDPKEFALVVPVPTVVARDAIKVTTNQLVDHLDSYTAPRLVEYFDPDPCRQIMPVTAVPSPGIAMMARQSAPSADRARSLGVTIEAQYTVGEYDILILSAKQSDGLATWLNEEGYKTPPGAAPVLGSYIKQDMKFFVARVNLKEQSRLGFQYLRPIQVTYTTPKFMLPIRLGTVNANGPQDMLMFMLTETGRVETTNYRTVRLPSNMDVPLFVKAEFGSFYKAMFDKEVAKLDMRAVYLEYAWNMAWCDPCAADPIPDDKLVELGAFWLADAASGRPGQTQGRAMPPRGGGPQNVFVTRLHVRYDAQRFPEDLMFQETADRGNYQGRYVLRHPFTGAASCPAGETYRASLKPRFAKEAETLATLTGWDMGQIRDKMSKAGQRM